MTKRQGKSGTINVKAVVAEDEEFLRALVRAALQEVLEAEMTEALGAEKGRARIMRAREVVEVGWPADQVERWPIDRLIPYAKNSRTHSEAQIAQLAASMKEWGWTNPVLADEEGGVIAGHARILAARQLRRAEAGDHDRPHWAACPDPDILG